MSETFRGSLIRVRPGEGEEAVVESGGRQMKVSLAEEPTRTPEKPNEEEIVRTDNPNPPIGMRALAGGVVIAELGAPVKLGSEADARSIDSWIERLDASPDLLHVEVEAAEVTTEQLRPLIALSNRHGLEIELKLQGDG